MAAHRKRKKRPRGFAAPASRTAATLALAGAATATASAGAAHAEPVMSPAQVKAAVNTLYQQAEVATQRYDGARENADKARLSLRSLRDEAARGTERLNTARDALGSVVSAQYRSAGFDPAVQLALSTRPDEFLDSAQLAERAGSRDDQTVHRVRREQAGIDQLHAEADHRLADLRAKQRELAHQKSAVKEKLARAKALLDQLPPGERASYGDFAMSPSDAAGSHGGPTARPAGRAAAAVAFAYGALGKPYVWGATGPGSYDCSGLTQAAWRAAGVSLPRTTYTQINAGRRVDRSHLAPGDLVFFFSGVSHVGLYIGDGQMIHAPHPGAPVRVAPIEEMPFAGATRPI